jgi:hypothetical protein
MTNVNEGNTKGQNNQWNTNRRFEERSQHQIFIVIVVLFSRRAAITDQRNNIRDWIVTVAQQTLNFIFRVLIQG